MESLWLGGIGVGRSSFVSLTSKRTVHSILLQALQAFGLLPPDPNAGHHTYAQRGK